jgi:hypothetical protein
MEKIQIRRRATFDSGATPKESKSARPVATLADVDLGDLKVKMAATIEQAKENDPTELKRTISELRRKLAAAEQKAPEAKTIEVSIFDPEDKKALAKANEVCDDVLRRNEMIRRDLAQVLADIKRLQDSTQSKLRNAPANIERVPLAVQRAAKETFGRTVTTRIRPPLATPANGEVSGGLRRMMIALARRPGLIKQQLGVRAGLSSKSGTFGTYLGRLRSNGWIENSGEYELRLTEDGLAALGHYDPLPEGQELLEYWLRELGDSGGGRMLRCLADVYPKALSKAALGEMANISHTSGTFGTYLGRLRSLELVVGRSELQASPEFFE